MTVEVHWDVPECSRARLGGFTDEMVAKVVGAALEEGGCPSLVVTVVFVSDDALCALHGEFLEDETPTDVIAFDLSGDDEGGPDAELYVSVDAAFRSAPAYDLAVENEILLYVAHGTLHLCGFEDHVEEDRRAMRQAEVRALKRVEIELDASRHERE